MPHRTDGNQRRQWIAAWRRGRLALVGITMIGLAILLHGLRPDLLIWYWNPYVPLLAYVLFLFACWSVACRDWIWLPVAVVVGSVIVQLHVAYVPLVASAAVATAVVLWLTRRTVDDRKKRAPSRRVVVAAAGLFVAVWAPVGWDLAFGSHNLAHVVRYFGHSGEPSAGFSTGLGILSRHLGPRGPWSGGKEAMTFLNVPSGPIVWLAAFAVGLPALLVAAIRRRQTSSVALVGLAVSQLVACAAAVHGSRRCSWSSC